MLATVTVSYLDLILGCVSGLDEADLHPTERDGQGAGELQWTQLCPARPEGPELAPVQNNL